ncbi:hypothetical protein [Georgenia sp. H159]|uniref:hypothetical protein n=1 Tax=Georgenia sp. H159 TaxID=3076115 RepID=UPI002D775F6C|nr:hypothetical protein [Georgenia sp. H159]
MNRAERRLLSRARKQWLAAVAADPRLGHDELLVAQWIAEHADDDGAVHIDLDEISKAVTSWPR